MKKIGVYRILNKINNKCYIGSSVDLQQRLSHHKADLRKGRHENNHLQAAWNKYREMNFKFIILLFCEQDILIKKEQEKIEFYQAYSRGYNLCPLAGNCLGFKHTEESKNKMKGNVNGRGGKGKIVSEETRQKQRQVKLGKPGGMKNKTHSSVTKEKMRKAKIGKPSPNKGKVCSNETRRKISVANKGCVGGMSGRHHSIEARQKISINSAMKGKHHTEEAKRKIKDAWNLWIIRNKKIKEIV